MLVRTSRPNVLPSSSDESEDGGSVFLRSVVPTISIGHLKMVAVGYTERLAPICHTTQCYNPQDHNVNLPRT